jgi:putative transposase
VAGAAGRLPTLQVVFAYHARWARDGTLNQLHNALREQVRLAEGRHPEPSAALVDSDNDSHRVRVAASPR